MSVLIKGMEMPTDHPLWIVVHSDGTVEANEVSASRPVGWQTLRNAAVPVPPHGRLIEDEAVREQIDEWLDSVGDVVVGHGLSYYGELLGCIEDAPTIIPAEEEK